MKVALAGGSPVTLASAQSNPRAIAVDATSVYWANYGIGSNDGTVMKVALAGDSPVTLASGLYQPNGLAVDATSVYWTNNNDGTEMKVAK
jgi:DNA-binding beta-propeller fold protein YncE